MNQGWEQMKKIGLIMGGVIASFFGVMMLPMMLFGEMQEGASRVPGVVVGTAFLAAGIFCFCKLYLIAGGIESSGGTPR